MLVTNKIDSRFVDSFNIAVANVENHSVECHESGEINWDYVESDMIMDDTLAMFSVGEIVDALYLLADIYDGKVAA